MTAERPTAEELAHWQALAEAAMEPDANEETFFAASRDAVPRLVARARELEAELAALSRTRLVGEVRRLKRLVKECRCPCHESGAVCRRLDVERLHEDLLQERELHLAANRKLLGDVRTLEARVRELEAKASLDDRPS